MGSHSRETYATFASEAGFDDREGSGGPTGACGGLALVGSYARGQARPDSDVDLILLVDDPDIFRVDAAWLAEIAWSRAGIRPVEWKDAQYGAVWSRHVLLDNGLEIEFSFASPSWANTAPIDAGTQRVVADGCRILHDPRGVLAALCNAAGSAGNLAPL